MHFTVLVILFSIVPFTFGQSINICPTREITASSGQIKSPNYPSNYPSNTACTLTIKQPLDRNFTFTFNKVDIEGDEEGGELSCYDSLTISGKSSKDFCGTTTPKPFTPGLNVVTLKMTSDGSVEQSGFDLSFTSAQTPGLPPAVSVCPTRTITPSAIGRVHSPGFAGTYSVNLNCKLTLDVPSNKEVEISYNYRDIEFAAQCAKDKLTIADNTASRYTCGSSSLASTATYRDGDVSFHFTTDGSGTGSGFIATYKLIDKAVATCSCANGNSYIKRPITKNNIIKRADDDISLDFKTSKADGLFFYAKGGLRDFILLKLQNGNIVFEVDLGTGNLTVKVPSGSLNDDSWHTVVVKRRGKSVQVSVDNLAQVSAQTGGSFTFLDIKPQNGLPAAMYSLGGPSGIRYDVNFQGCVRNFKIDGMKPVEAYLQNNAEYTMYGSTTMGTC